jgi:extracellular elastinolytic metalloproteinase
VSSSRPPLRIIITTVAAASLALSFAGVAQGEQRREQQKLPVVQGDGHGKPDRDNRKGRVAPPLSARKPDKATVRWNDLGTPALVTSEEPLAEGLAVDPVQAAHAYLKGNQGLFGLQAEAVDALETVAVNPVRGMPCSCGRGSAACRPATTAWCRSA